MECRVYLPTVNPITFGILLILQNRENKCIIDDFKMQNILDVNLKGFIVCPG